MKILMISSFLPYPLINGGNIRLYNLLKNLSKKYEVTLVCEKREYQTEDDIKEVQRLCKKVIPLKRRKQWTISNILKSAFSLSPFLIVGHENTEMRKAINNELTNNIYDLIHVETFYVMQNLPKTNVPVVLIEHNIEYSVYKKFVNYSPIFLKPFLSWDVHKLEISEKSFWKKAKILVAVSQKEKEIMGANSVVPNGVDLEKFKFQTLNEKEEERIILFIGDFKWIENRDAAKWIIKEVWPKLKGFKLWIVGRAIPEHIRKLTKDINVVFDENAPKETQLIYKKTYLLLSPIRVGGGTSFKILEAMASGVPVITTSLGAEGITENNEIIRADTLAEIVNSINKLNDRNYYKSIARRARKLVEEKYNWKKITGELEKVYDMTRV